MSVTFINAPSGIATNKIAIFDAGSTSNSGNGLKVGDEIVNVNGRSVITAQETMYQFMTQKNRNFRHYCCSK